MKILVLGSLQRARALLADDANPMRQVFHCKKDIRVTRSFSPIDPPDWILIEETALPTEGISLLQSLHAMDFYCPPGQQQKIAPALRDHPPTSGCCLERDAEGRIRLHCGLRQARQAASATRDKDPPQGEAAICFEYQAPLRRRSS
jgi:hypothetical protein